MGYKMINIIFFLLMNELKNYIRLNEMYRKKQYRRLIDAKLRNIENKYINYLSLFNKKKYEIVIAKYNEDISWSYPYKHLTTIYNKSDIKYPNSKKLSNVGRESHTYLYHIISNWDNLAEITLFTQGELSNEHRTFPIPAYFLLSPSYVSNIGEQGIIFKNGNRNYLRHHGKWLNEYINKEMKPAIISFQDFWSIFSDNSDINFDKCCGVMELFFQYHAN